MTVCVANAYYIYSEYRYVFQGLRLSGVEP
jgi:hypothetical protein